LQPQLPYKFFAFGLHRFVAHQTMHVGLAILFRQAGFDRCERGPAEELDQGVSVDVVEQLVKVHGAAVRASEKVIASYTTHYL